MECPKCKSETKTRQSVASSDWEMACLNCGWAWDGWPSERAIYKFNSDLKRKQKRQKTGDAK